MKRLPFFTGALALGFLLTALYRKMKSGDNNAENNMEPAPHSHHLTDVFAKAKKVSAGEAK